MDSPPEFVDIQSELLYWKEKARNLKVELEEFADDSHQLEKELEITIKLKEEQVTDLRHKFNKQQHDNDNLLAKLKQYEHDLAQWEQRFQKEKTEKEQFKKYTRELEQKNDDLERGQRIITESMTEIERMLNREYEKNVMLEVECEMEKENAQIQLQRLMDETRDLKQELKVRKRHSSSDTKQEISENMDINDKKTPDPKTLKNLINIQEGDSTVIAVGDHNSLINDNVGYTNSSATVSCQTTPQATVQRESSLKQLDRLKNGGSMMTASSRSTALAIVADLLRRVNLDSKLLICITCKRFRCDCSDIVPDATNKCQDTRIKPCVVENIDDSSNISRRPISLSSIISTPTSHAVMQQRANNCEKHDSPSFINTSSSWLMDKIQTTANKLKTKNIDATIKDLKRPKSLYDDLENNHKSPSGDGKLQADTPKSPSSLIY